MQKALADPACVKAVEETRAPTVFIDAGGEHVAMATAVAMRDLARR